MTVTAISTLVLLPSLLELGLSWHFPCLSTLFHCEYSYLNSIYTLMISKYVFPECSYPLSLTEISNAYSPSPVGCLIDISKYCCQTAISPLHYTKPTSFSVFLSITTHFGDFSHFPTTPHKFFLTLPLKYITNLTLFHNLHCYISRMLLSQHLSEYLQ